MYGISLTGIRYWSKKETILLVSDEKHEIKTLFAFIRAVQESR